MRAFRVLTLLIIAGCRTLHPYPPLTGRVVDPAGNPVGGAEVRIDGRTVGTTAADGTFSVRCPPSPERVPVTLSAPRFATTTRIFNARATGVINTVVVWPRAAAQRMRVPDGGKLVFPGATITFPTDAFVDATGRRIDGDVDVSLTTIDVTNPRQLASAPGDFTARMRDGSIRNLETFGLFELVAESNGREVKFARGKAATVELDRSRSDRQLPEITPAFTFEPPSGPWVEVASSWQLGGTYTNPTVDEIGYWNVDMPAETTCIKVKVLGCNVVAGTTTVTATGLDYWGTATIKGVDGNGEACLLVKKDARVAIDISSGSLTANQLVVQTPNTVLNDTVCNCPLVTATHLTAAPLNNPQTSLDSSNFSATNNTSIASLNPSPPFGVVWLTSQVAATPSSATLNMSSCSGSACLGRQFKSGEYKSNCFYGYGTYTITMGPLSPEPGLITGFFTYTDHNDGTVNEDLKSGHDEIDIELLDGSVKNCASNEITLHMNYYAKQPSGASGHEQNECVPNVQQTYKIVWKPDKITWHAGTQSWPVLRPAGGEWPTQPGRIFLNLWGNSETDPLASAWTSGPYMGSGNTATFSNLTFVP